MFFIEGTIASEQVSIKCQVPIAVTDTKWQVLVSPPHGPVLGLCQELFPGMSWIWLKCKNANILLGTMRAKLLVEDRNKCRIGVLMWFKEESTMYTQITPTIKKDMITVIR